MRYRPPAPDEVVLARHDGHLEARAQADPPGRGVWARWPAPSSRSGGSALLRAIGDAESVIDATGGFGVDAWMLALAGRRVTVIERSPIVAALLADAVERANPKRPADNTNDPSAASARDSGGTADALGAHAAARLRLIEGDSRRVLRELVDADLPDAIYLDPMFPPKRRASALASKEMQFLAAIVGDDSDASELLEIARGFARKRVVVKRPPHAPPLAPNPDFTIETKLLRIDGYLVQPKGGSE